MVYPASGAVNSDIFIHKLPSANLTYLTLNTITWSKMANFTKFNQLTNLSLVYGQYKIRTFGIC